MFIYLQQQALYVLDKSPVYIFYHNNEGTSVINVTGMSQNVDAECISEMFQSFSHNILSWQLKHAQAFYGYV